MRRLLPYLLLALSCFTLQAQKDKTSLLVETALVDAVQKYSDGDNAQALAYFRKLNQLDPDNDAVLYYLALTEYSLGQMDSTLVHMAKAVEKDTTNLWYVNGLASAYLEKGDTRSAAAIFKHLVEKRPQSFANSYVLTILGDTSMQEYKDSLAMDYYDKALYYDPGYVPASLGRAEILRMRGNYPAFFVSLEDIVDNPEAPSGVKSSYLTAIVEHMDSRFFQVWGGKVGSLVDKCVEMHPDDLQSRYLKMQFCFIDRDTLGVMEQCREMVARAGKDTEKELTALSIMGDMYHSMGQPRMAYQMYERALKLNPRYVPVLNNYAYYLCLEGKKLRKALKMSAITIEEEPDNATYLDTYGWLLYLLHRPKEAKPYFKHAMIYGGKGSPEVLAHYSKVLEALGEKDLAEYYRMLSENK